MNVQPKFLVGFTLLELLVAIAIFSVLSAAAYTGLRNFLSAQQILQLAETEFSSLQRAVMLIETDINNAFTRGIRDEFGDKVAAMLLAGDNTLEFTRRRPNIPLEFSLVDLVRIDYILENGIVSRRRWLQLDRVPNTTYEQRELLTGVESLSWSFFRNGWQDYWPIAQDAYSETRLPSAVKLLISFEDGRSLERVFLIGNQG